MSGYTIDVPAGTVMVANGNGLFAKGHEFTAIPDDTGFCSDFWEIKKEEKESTQHDVPAGTVMVATEANGTFETGEEVTVTNGTLSYFSKKSWYVKEESKYHSAPIGTVMVATITDHVFKEGEEMTVSDNTLGLFNKDRWAVKTPEPVTNDLVNTPNHYMIIGNTEACDLIDVMLVQYVKDFPEATPYQIYCAGNAFKYRLRAGSKDNVEQEIKKAQKYKEMHDV